MNINQIAESESDDSYDPKNEEEETEEEYINDDDTPNITENNFSKIEKPKIRNIIIKISPNQ
jgi:hypothetical protein